MKPEEMEYRSGEKVRQARTAVVRKVENQERVLDFILSTETRDRYNTEVIGWELKQFRQNPQLQWAHNYYIPSIGNALRIGVDADKRLVTRGEFTPPEINPFGYEIYTSYAEGWMRTWSAGFVPSKVEYVPPTDEEVTAAAKKGDVARGYYRLLKNNLLEGSACPIPGNAECVTLMQRGLAARSFEPMLLPEFSLDMTQDEYTRACDEFMAACKSLTEWNGEKMDVAKRRVADFFAKRGAKVEVVSGTWDYGDHACERCGAPDEDSHAFDCEHARTVVGQQRDKKRDDEAERERLNVPSAQRAAKGGILVPFGTSAEVIEQLRAALPDGMSVQVIGENVPTRGALPYKKEKLAPADTEWNAQREMAAATIDDLWEMSAFHSGDGEKKSDFKLSHHRQSDHATVFAGVKLAMQQLAAGRTSANIASGDKAKCFKHLAMHYKEFDAEAPTLKAFNEKGEVTPCTPEAFFERMALSESVSRGEGFGRNRLIFARTEEGADTATMLCSIEFRAGELDETTPRDRFISACARWFDEAPAEKTRVVLLGIAEHGGIAGVLIEGQRDVPQEPTFLALLVDGIGSADEIDRDSDLVKLAAEVPLTLAQVRELFEVTGEALRDEEHAATLRENLAVVVASPFLRDGQKLDGKAVLAAFDADVETFAKDERDEKAREAQELLGRVAELLAEATGTDLREVDHTATSRSEDDDEGDEEVGDAARDLADELENYMGGGAVDASKRLSRKAGRNAEDDSDDGGGENQPANNAEQIREVEALLKGFNGK